MTPGRRLAVVVALDALGALLLLASAGRTWLTVLESRPRPLPDVVTPLSGADLGGTRAVGLLALAAVAALPAARGALRPVVGLVLVVAGLAAVAEGAQAVGFPETAVSDPSVVGSVLTVTGWPVAAAAGGGLLAVAGVLAVVWRRSLAGLSTRYARTPAGRPGPPPPAVDPAASAAPDDTAARPGAAPSEAELWDALDAGRDPTRDPEEA